MKSVFTYLGNNGIPYRTIMENHTDFIVNGIVIPKHNTVITEQTHSRNIHVCHQTDSGAGFDDHSQIMNCDGLVTNIPNQFLLIRTADCTPVLFYDSINRAVGAVHSGRDGTRKNISQALIQTMYDEYGTSPEYLQVWIGAGICKDHYEVSPEMWDDFARTCAKDRIIVSVSDRPYLNIQEVILQQLISSGIKEENIQKNTICTYESETHFSFRRNGSKNRQINLIGLIDG